MADDLDIDPAELARRGISNEEVARQLALFRDPPGYADLLRSCSVGDGIEQIEDGQACLDAYERARAAGRLSKFVPASGAASRMFQALLAMRGETATADELERRAADGDGAAGLVAAVLRGAAELPMAEQLRKSMRERGEDLDKVVAAGRLSVLVDALVAADAMRLGSTPKGLLPFHRYPDGRVLTPFEEHLHEAVDLVRDDEGRTRLHFTVSEEHVGEFKAKLAAARGDIEGDGRTKLLVGFSTQSPSTDTIAVDLENRPFRAEDGRVVFRPGGHGALLDNLNRSGGDIALVQNVDNIQPADRRAESVHWKKILIGRLVQLQETAAAVLQRRDGQPPEWMTELFDLPRPNGSRGPLIEALNRPIRVAGVVRNLGEPGGGPFWVRAEDGSISRQIVESAQVDAKDADQAACFRDATHFNPVVLACGLRDAAGHRHDLTQFVDPRAVFISRKSFEGRDLKALERPGLWNGSMGHWATVFVEIGQAAFTPVKTIADLLRPEHQPGGGQAPSGD